MGGHSAVPLTLDTDAVAVCQALQQRFLLLPRLSDKVLQRKQRGQRESRHNELIP